MNLLKAVVTQEGHMDAKRSNQLDFWIASLRLVILLRADHICYNEGILSLKDAIRRIRPIRLQYVTRGFNIYK